MLNIQGMDASINSTSHWKLPFLIEQLESEYGYTPILAICESWLKSHHTDAQVCIPNYQTLRADRKGRDCGGALLYIHNKLPTINVKYFDDDICEAVVCTIISTNTIVASIYRPPDAPSENFKNMMKFLQTYIDNASGTQHINILVLGDFNLPILRWKDEPVPPQYKYLNVESAETLMSFININFLSQYVDKPNSKRKYPRSSAIKPSQPDQTR